MVLGSFSTTVPSISITSAFDILYFLSVSNHHCCGFIRFFLRVISAGIKIYFLSDLIIAPGGILQEANQFFPGNSVIDQLNMFPVRWDVDPLDWCYTNVDKIVRSVLAGTKENSIILMHDSYDSTVTAALQVVDILKAEGYEFVTVDEILFD